jgi:DNA (cytosine-5)-methyltransferase 1
MVKKSMKPKLLDLFCGAGGAAMGYHRAGFEVVGVDIKPQPHYPFEFIQADAITFPLDGYNVIHASPPCQRYSQSTKKVNKSNHPDLIAPIRSRLQKTENLWIIENVPGAPLRGDIVLCGYMMGLRMIKRKRLFETNAKIFSLFPSLDNAGHVITVAGNGTPTGSLYIWGRQITIQECSDAMGIHWMTRKELNNAIPPAYTEWIGKQLIKKLRKREEMI